MSHNTYLLNYDDDDPCRVFFVIDGEGYEAFIDNVSYDPGCMDPAEDSYLLGAYSGHHFLLPLNYHYTPYKKEP